MVQDTITDPILQGGHITHTQTIMLTPMPFTMQQVTIQDITQQMVIVVSQIIVETHIIKMPTTQDMGTTLTLEYIMQDTTLLDMAIILMGQVLTLTQHHIMQETILLGMALTLTGQALTLTGQVPTLIQHIQEITLLALVITLTQQGILQETMRLVPRLDTRTTVRSLLLVVLLEMLGQKTPEEQVQLEVLGESSLSVELWVMPATR